MGHGLRDGDVIATTNPIVGALTMSQDLANYRPEGMSARYMWETQSAVRTVVGFITDSIAAVPFNLYDRVGNGGRRKNSDHRIARGLWSPGYKRGQRRWVQQLMFDYCIEGRWAFTVYEHEDGKFEFLRLPADRIAFAVDGNGRFTDLVLYTKAGKVTRPLDDVVFDVGVSGTFDGEHKGSTPLTALEGLARELEGMSEYRANLFRNSAMVPAVIERPVDAGKWSDESWQRFKREFSTYRAGGGNAGGTPILEDGMSLKPVDVFNPKDAQYVEVRELALVEAAQAMRIPPELVGAKDGTHSNIVALREQLYVDVLGPQIGFFEDALNVGLDRWIGPDRYVEANLDVKLRGSLEDRAKVYQTAGGRPWMTTNEIRERENLEHIDGGDLIVTPLNVLLGGQASPADGGATGEHDGAGAPADPAKAANTTPSGFTPDEIAKLVTAASGLIRSGFAPAAALEAVGLDPIEHLGLLPVTVQRPQEPEGDPDEAIEEALKAVSAVGASRAARGTVDRFKAMSAAAVAAQQQLQPGGAKAGSKSKRSAVEEARQRFEAAAVVKGHELRDRWLRRLGIDPTAKSNGIPDNAVPVIDPEWFVDDVDEVAAWLSGHTAEIAATSAEELLDYAAANIEDWSREAQLAWIQTAAKSQANLLVGSRFHQIVADVIAANPAGWKDDVLEQLGDDDAVEKWATTVGTEVESFGSHDAAKAAGLSSKTWVVTSSNPRESHARLSGTTIPIEDTFSNGLRWPGDWYGDGPETANCRCRLSYS